MSLAPNVAGAAWDSTAFQLNNESGATTSQGAPDIVRVPGGNALYAVWESSETGESEIFLRCSPDLGATWNAPINVTNFPASEQTSPRLAVNKVGPNVVLVIGMIHLGNPTVDRRSISPAAPCAIPAGNPIRVDFSSPLQPEAFDVDVDASGTVYVTWVRNQGGTNSDNVMFLTLPPGTTTPTAPLILHGDASFRTEIIAAGASAATTTVVIAAEIDGADNGNDLLLMWSFDGGSTWPGSSTLSAGTTDLIRPSIDFHRFLAPIEIYQAYVHTTFSDVRVRRVRLGATTATQVGSEVTISTGDRPFVTALANVGDALLTFSQSQDVFAATTTDTGGTWSSAINITPGAPIGTNTQRNARNAVGSGSYAVFESDQDTVNKIESRFIRDTPGVTALRIESLRADRDGGRVRISWLLTNAFGVEAMWVERGDGLTLGEVPFGLTDLVEVIDEEPGPASAYTVRVRLGDGTIESYGPVSAEGAAGASHGCGAGWMSAMIVVGSLRLRRSP